MESLKSWAMTICFAAVAAGLANIVAPKGNLEKVYKFAVSLFFLCCVLVPLFNLKGISVNLNPQSQTQQQNSNLQSTIQDQKLRLTESSVSELIMNCCGKVGVKPVRVVVTAVADKNGVISIKGGVVTVKKTDMQKENDIISTVKQDLQIDVTVVREGENSG